jgi:hypothetical protein
MCNCAFLKADLHGVISCGSGGECALVDEHARQELLAFRDFPFDVDTCSSSAVGDPASIPVTVRHLQALKVIELASWMLK